MRSRFAQKEATVPAPVNYEEDDMDSMVLDLTEVKEEAMEPIPAGWVDCIIEEVEAKRAESSGAPMLAWKFKVLDVEGQEEIKGRRLFWNTVLNHNFGLVNAKKASLICDPTADLSGVRPADFSDLCVGKHISVKTSVKLYQGRRRNEVRDIRPISEGGFLS